MAACTTPDLDQYWWPASCRDDAVQYVEGIDWSRARIVSIRIRQGEYNPLIIRLLQDQPYVFRIINRDDEFRDFRAVEFFEAVAIENVSISGIDTGEYCVTSVTVPPMQTAELRFVAVRDGRYEFEDQPLPFPGIAAWGGSGVISINMKSSIPIARYSNLVPSKTILGRPLAAPLTPVESEEEDADEEEDARDEDDDDGETSDEPLFADEEDEDDGEAPRKTKKAGKKPKDLFGDDDEEGAAPPAKETKTVLDVDRDAAAPGRLQEILKDEPGPDDDTTKSLEEILRGTEVVPKPPDGDTDADSDTEAAPDEDVAPDAKGVPDEAPTADEEAPARQPAGESKTVPDKDEPSKEEKRAAGKVAPGASLFDSVFGRVIDVFDDFVPAPKDR